jgi:TonB family protein
MKLSILRFLAFSLLFVNNVNASQELPELQEAATLTASVVKLCSEAKYNEALPLAKRALQIREKLLPRTDQRVLDSLANLGEIYIGKQDYDSAKDIYKRLLQAQEERFSSESVNLAPTLDRLAPLQYRALSFRDAEESYQRALALREKVFGSNHEEVARSVFAIAEFYRKRKDLTRATEDYRRALTMYGQLSGIYTSEFERTSDGYACLGYEHQKKEVFSEMQEIRKQFAPELHEPDPYLLINGRAYGLPKPDYPEEARKLRLAGTVTVKVMIDEAGNVISAKDICYGPPYLSESSVAAALKARFSATKLNGMPVKVVGIIQYRFVPR